MSVPGTNSLRRCRCLRRGDAVDGGVGPHEGIHGPATIFSQRKRIIIYIEVDVLSHDLFFHLLGMLSYIIGELGVV